ncbi:MAG: SDR family NAD(P)-dependent oxidoreductase, partial [Ignavibacteriales bacterium]|nr:SDR family NAD(P)-dependent oxidoreductase [Ignavibacteriales bacterium]
MSLDGMVALVTGSGKGIGRAVAERFAHAGASIALNARTRRDLETVQSEIIARGGRAVIAQGDITNEESLGKVFEQVDREFGRLDILVNNAGIGRFAPVRDLRVDDFDAMWNLNIRALFQCTKLALERMERQASGTIVNVSSLAGRNAFIGGAGYAATKWALIGFSRCLMLEVREKNIRVIAVCPGSVDTTFSGERDPEKAGKILAADDVA